MTQDSEACAVELRGIAKAFGAVQANAGIDLRVQKGSIHAVIGENGAGKSTAMKMLYGIYRPDAGQIFVNGVERSWNSPRDAILAGVGMVHQHFMLAEPETALENVLLEGAPSSPKWNWLPPLLRPLQRQTARSRLRALAKNYHLEVDWDARVETLPVGVQQRIEILKLLYHDASILILDEPTAVLTPLETQQLFANLRTLASEGKTILIITHKLKEVMSVADRVTVFRAGRVIGHREVAQTSVEELAALMVGRNVNLKIAVPPVQRTGRAVVEFNNFNQGVLKNLNFSVRAGEVVGIAGVEGNGQSELLRVLLHPSDYSRAMTGKMAYFGTDASGWDSAQVRASGVGVIPEDRLREALVLDWSLTENFLLGLQNSSPFRTRSGFVAQSVLRERTEAAIREYDVRPAQADALAGGLSGGNQQKLVIAREFEAKPRFLIAAQPTRGVDVGAIEFIHARILRARGEGTGVLVVSSELDEVLALSDRVLVMYGGAVVGEFLRVGPNREFDEEKIGLSMGGAHS
jgi:simple sugar transport system ATP-binding protein